MLKLISSGLALFLISSLVSTGPAVAQQPAAPPAEDPLGPPTERGIRMTPGMARAMGQLFTKNVLVPHYEMDEAKSAEAAELVSRRLMSAAHAMDTHGSELIELFMTRMSESSADHPNQGPDNPFTPEFGKSFAEKVLPVMPAVRDLVGGIGRDVMPLLPFKQQMKMTAEMVGAGTMINGFEQNMQRWVRGEMLPGEDPFSSSPPAGDQAKKDLSGQSPALKAARDAAQKALDKQKWLSDMWDSYLKDFKKFYELDESQSATADSLLREYLERARILMQDAAWRDQIYRSRLWLRMLPMLKMDPVFTNILNSRYDEAMAPLNALGDDFRSQLEVIPTEGQKKAAEAKINAALKERGYETTEAN